MEEVFLDKGLGAFSTAFSRTHGGRDKCTLGKGAWHLVSLTLPLLRTLTPGEDCLSRGHVPSLTTCPYFSPRHVEKADTPNHVFRDQPTKTCISVPRWHFRAGPLKQGTPPAKTL